MKVEMNLNLPSSFLFCMDLVVAGYIDGIIQLLASFSFLILWANHPGKFKIYTLRLKKQQVRLFMEIVLIFSDSFNVTIKGGDEKVGFALILSFLLFWFLSTALFLYGIAKVRKFDQVPS